MRATKKLPYNRISNGNRPIWAIFWREFSLFVQLLALVVYFQQLSIDCP